MPTKGIHLIPQVVKSASDLYQIPSAQARYKASVQGAAYFPVVVIDGVVAAHGRLLTAAEYENLIDGLSIQEY